MGTIRQALAGLRDEVTASSAPGPAFPRSRGCRLDPCRPKGYSGARDVFVGEEDLQRAHEMLASEQGSFSDEELGRLSEEAVRGKASDEPRAKDD